MPLSQLSLTCCSMALQFFITLPAKESGEVRDIAYIQYTKIYTSVLTQQ